MPTCRDIPDDVIYEIPYPYSISGSSVLVYIRATRQELAKELAGHEIDINVGGEWSYSSGGVSLYNSHYPDEWEWSTLRNAFINVTEHSMCTEPYND